MTRKRKPLRVTGAAAGGGELLVHCVRLDAMRLPAEHLRCSYCFGRDAEIRAGLHRRFCDFDAERDPVSFGFPSSHGRAARS